MREGEAGWKIGGGCMCGRCVTNRRSVLSGLGKGAIVTSASSVLSGGPTAPANAEAYLSSRASWYQELFAYVLANNAFEEKMAKYRSELFPRLRNFEDGRQILDLGIGPGKNLKYYAEMGKGFHIIGVDPNPSMEKYIEAEVAEVGIPADNFQFVHAAGEDIPMEDDSVDAVVCTWVLCSVSDPAKTISEIKRVLRAGGGFLFIEHVAAPDGRPLRWLQNILDPVQALVADGCHLNRNTLATIEAGQFESVDAKFFNFEGGGPLAPHIMGIARIP